MPRPRSGDWLEDEIRGWRDQGIDTVVSLLEAREVSDLGLHDEARLCVAAGINFISHPIPDRGTPHSLEEFKALVDALGQQLDQGRSIALHCRAGIGRTGLLGACLLAKLGVPIAKVFPTLSSARGVPMPDTDEQIVWVQQFARESR